MATAPDSGDGDLFDEFLSRRGHDPDAAWEREYNKKRCPDCGGVHDLDAARCTVCDWKPD